MAATLSPQYLAGFFDAEGSVSISRVSREKERISALNKRGEFLSLPQ